ncbi:subtilisin AprE [soil metagenome]
MRRALFVLVALTALGSQVAYAAPDAGRAGRYIVVLKDSADSHGVAKEHGNRYGARVAHVYEHALKGYAATVPDSRIDELRSDDRVVSVSRDQKVTLAAQTLPTGIDRVDGELSSTVSGNGSGSVGVDVAVIDTGIDVDHPDLNVVGGVNCSTGRSYDDGNGHGSHVAGTIAAKDDSNGVVGVAPGARLYAVRVLNNRGSGSFSSIICGVDWVTARAGTIEVANMSLGGSGTDPSAAGCSTGNALHDAVCESVAAGVTHVVAAGNSFADAKNFVPAAYDEVITTSALADFDGEPGGAGTPTCRSDVDDTFANFSNYGGDVDLIAPGVCIESTWKGGGYNTISGTSMASPHAAGAAALYLSTHPGTSPALVKSALQGAGTLNWNNVDDPDGIKEKLVNVAGF